MHSVGQRQRLTHTERSTVVCRAEKGEKARQKAAEHKIMPRNTDSCASRNGMEGMALKISDTTGSIIMNANGQDSGTGDGTQVAKKPKKERRDQREKRREKRDRQKRDQAPRPSKGSSKKGGSKRRPKVGA